MIANRLPVCWLVVLLAGGAFGSACGGSSGAGDGGPPDARDGDAATDDGGDAGQQHRPYLGILQFDVSHNLDDDSCVGRDDCFLTIENETATSAWLERIGAESNLAVLHWDRAVPWLAFDADVPAGSGRVAFFDARLDAGIRDWIDAFAAHFAASPHRYLAVTPLNGVRDGISPARIAGHDDIEVAPGCTALGPGTQLQFSYDVGSGQQQASLDLQRSYTNFVLYLYDKLRPDYLALMIEVNLFKMNCPQQWAGLVELYRQLYDAVRAEAGPALKLFATLTFKDLLAFDLDRCLQLQIEPCSGNPVQPDYPQPDPLDCYPLELSAIADLDQGDRLDILALSFYPDALSMAVGEQNLIRVYPEDWDGSSACDMRAYYIPFLDPFAALDRFGWSKPVALAEVGARSCPILAYLLDGDTTMILELSADPTSQAFWLEQALSTAERRHFVFYVQSFLRDYQPIGLWTVRQGVFDPFMFGVFNGFACMGLFDYQDQPKSQVTATWQEHRR